jgi:exopolysaccharide production protein ExoQ
MNPASPYRLTLATIGFFTLIAGEAWRYLLSWWGYGAIVAVLVILAVIELVRSREDVRRLPLLLLATLTLMLVSVAWSAYPAASAVGVILTLATTTYAVFLATCFTWAELVDFLALALRIILGLSLAFELAVAIFVRGPVLPLCVDY